MGFKKIIKKIVYREKASSETFIDYLRKKGIRIGQDCTIYSPAKTFIDVQYPWMITIGDHVRITEGVKILTHDYAWSVLKGLNSNSGGAIFGASGKVSIGNNVFIGMNTIITRNVVIGNNVVIGAGSVVTGNCEDNGVYAGNPARKIMDIEEYFCKRKSAQAEEAKLLAKEYYACYGKKPESHIFHEYFMVFSDKDAVMENSIFSSKMKLCDNEQQSYNYLQHNAPAIDSFQEFMRYCFNEE